jgi:hypothetical protein
VHIQRTPFLLAGVITLVTAAAHAFVGQSHLTRILETSVQGIDSAVMFAVWHMVTAVLVMSGLIFLWLMRCKQRVIVRAITLTMAILFGLFGTVFILTSILYKEPTVQWIPMLMVSCLSLVGFVTSRRSDL